MSKKIVLLILDKFADWEGAYLSTVLRDEEMGPLNQVLWASIDKKPKKSLGNLTVLPDITLEEIPEDIDALILIGGASWRTKEVSRVVPYIRKFKEKGKVIRFICDATYFAAKEDFNRLLISSCFRSLQASQRNSGFLSLARL